MKVAAMHQPTIEVIVAVYDLRNPANRVSTRGLIGQSFPTAVLRDVVGDGAKIAYDRLVAEIQLEDARKDDKDERWR